MSKNLRRVGLLLLCVALGGGCGGSGGGGTVTPVPSSGPTPIVTPNPSGVPTPSVTPGVTINPTPDITPGVTPGVSPDITPTVTAMPTPAFSVNVRDYGAKGDGVTDDTAAIQKAIDAVAGKSGETYVPDGTYLINVEANSYSGYHGLALRSDMTFRMAVNATLKAKSTVQSNYSIIQVREAKNVKIIGGTLEGDRYGHGATSGELGCGVFLRDACENILVKDVTAKNCWGDGFIAWGLPLPPATSSAANSAISRLKNITFDNVTADGNRRQGLSVINVDGIRVLKSTFRNTGDSKLIHGPWAGIDLEPEAHDVVRNVTIAECTFENNAGCGVLLAINTRAQKGSATEPLRDVVIEGCTFRGNGKGYFAQVFSGIGIAGAPKSKDVVEKKVKEVVVRNQKTMTGNGGRGISVFQGDHVTIRGNLIEGNLRGGIVVDSSDVTMITGGNRVLRNTGIGIHLYQTRNTTITDNEIGNNSGVAINVQDSPGTVQSGNNVY